VRESGSGRAVTVRAAEAGDADAVLGLARAFATSFVVEEVAFRRSFGILIDSPSARLLLAEEGGKVIGYALGFEHPAFYANGSVGWVEEVMVREGRRRRGVGARLMAGLEAWARARGCRLLALATRRAAPFYLALGYEESALYFRKVLEE
jgi:GNAT superfamily N-acetyltransferase